MGIVKHPSFCEVSLLPKEDDDMESLQRRAKETNDESLMFHRPYEGNHLKTKGNTHSNVRYFAKKYCKLGAEDPLAIAGLIRVLYPKIDYYFKGDLKRVFDICYRESKAQEGVNTANN